MTFKRILDSVHGNIYIEKYFFQYFIDTPEFQRLRRIEQSSIRSIFPSARHDRFIHSIGVFHIGSLIVKQLKQDAIKYKYYGLTELQYDKIVTSYRIACLLHDLGHAPFSHLFEGYYKQVKSDSENPELSNLQQKLLDIISLPKEDINNTSTRTKPHEYASAILIANKFRKKIEELDGDVELVVRMIIGAQYTSETDTEYVQIKNCFIQLLNGAVIDADRLDYACRDVWASGYATSTIDMERMVAGMHIAPKEENGICKYVVCYTSNVLNEIESVIDIKEFQHKYVFHHHTVVYENYLLKNAAEKMAIHYTTIPKEGGNISGKRALESIISLDALLSNVSIKLLPNDSDSKDTLLLPHLTDDDLVYLMKSTPENTYYSEWSSRQYSKFPLWKTPDEFFLKFKLKRDVSLTKCDFENKIKEALQDYGEILILEEEYKAREDIKNINIFIGNKVVSLLELNPDLDKRGKDRSFYYVYIPKPLVKSVPIEEGINRLRDEIYEHLLPVIKSVIETNKIEQ